MRWWLDRVAGGIAQAAWVGLAATSLAAQAPQTPAFRATVDSVRLDTRVVADDGGFVRGLTKDDFRVFEDGQEQTITAFSMVELAPPAIDAGPALPSDVSSNASFRDGRVYLLVLDDFHIHELRAVTVRELARRFIEHYTAPSDHVAIATIGGLDTGAQDFTNDRQRLLDAVARFKARVLPEAILTDMPTFAVARAEAPADAPAPISTPTELIPLQSLLTSVEWLGTVPDRRKALVLIGEGMVDRTTDPEVEGTILEIVSAAARSNVAIYSVDAHGLPTGPSGAVKPVAVEDDDPMSERRRRQQQGMRLLAEETGGASVVNSNAFDPLFARVVSDSSAYYLLGYTSTNKPSKRLKRLDVRVARPGTTVQVRRGYGDLSTAAAKRAANQAGPSPALSQAFQSPVPLTGIDLAVTASPLRGSGNRASVAIIVEGRGDREIELFIGAAQNGRMEASQRGALKPVSGATAGAAMQATAKLDLKPGRYHLRVAAVGKDTGAQGSVLHDFDVPDFSKENLSISGLTLVDVARGRTPTTRRSFSEGESIDVAAEVYWKRGMNDAVAIAATVVNERGEEMYRQAGTVQPSERPRQGVDFGVTIGLERWPPGVYRLTVEAETAGAKPFAAKRELTFVVTERPAPAQSLETDAGHDGEGAVLQFRIRVLPHVRQSLDPASLDEELPDLDTQAGDRPDLGLLDIVGEVLGDTVVPGFGAEVEVERRSSEEIHLRAAANRQPDEHGNIDVVEGKDRVEVGNRERGTLLNEEHLRLNRESRHQGQRQEPAAGEPDALTDIEELVKAHLVQPVAKLRD